MGIPERQDQGTESNTVLWCTAGTEARGGKAVNVTVRGRGSLILSLGDWDACAVCSIISDACDRPCVVHVI